MTLVVCALALAAPYVLPRLIHSKVKADVLTAACSLLAACANLMPETHVVPCVAWMLTSFIWTLSAVIDAGGWNM